MAKFKDKFGNEWTLNKQVTKFLSKGGYPALRNGRGTGGLLMDLYLENGEATGVNSMGNKYRYTSTGWKYVGKGTVSTGDTTEQFKPIKGSDPAAIVESETESKSILDDIGFTIEGGKRPNVFVLAFGILAVVGLAIWALRPKRKRRR